MNLIKAVTQPKIVIVLGMHRSGTSLVAQLIANWGAYMGNDLMPADRHNLNGYWEHNPLVAFHNKLLEKSNNKWFAPSEEINTRELLIEFGSEAITLVKQMDAGGKVWCWKDPRIAMFLDFWKEVLVGRDIAFIVTYRHPLDIASSLLIRDNLPASIALSLWEFSTCKIFQALSSGMSYKIIEYNKILSEPEKVCYELVHFLGISSQPPEKQDSFENMIKSVKSDLNHATPHIKHKLNLFQEDLLTIYKSSQIPVGFNIPVTQIWLLKEHFSLFKELSDRKNRQFAQLFFNHESKNFNEHDSLICEITDNQEQVFFKFRKSTNVKYLRFDPLDNFAEVRINSIKIQSNDKNLNFPLIISSNAIKVDNQVFLFGNDDPQIFIDFQTGYNVEIDQVIVEIEYLKKGTDVILQLLLFKSNEIKIKEEMLLRLTESQRITESEKEALLREVSLKKDLIQKLEGIIVQQGEQIEEINDLVKHIGEVTKEQSTIIASFQIANTEILNQIGTLRIELNKYHTELIKLRENVYIKLPKTLRIPMLLFRPFHLIRRIREKLLFIRNICIIRKSGFFEEDFYMQNNPDVKSSGMSGIKHFLLFGGFEGRNPSETFDSNFYLQQYPDVREGNICPLLHYILHGKMEGRKTLPDHTHETVLFEAGGEAQQGRLLQEVIKMEEWTPDNPNVLLSIESGLFNADYYLTRNADVKAAGVDPARHYYCTGWKEGRDPSAQFNNDYYLKTNPDVRRAKVNPLLHYIRFGKSENRKTQDTSECTPEPASTFEPADLSTMCNCELPVKIIAFYLPQFHPIPENDLWWGKGFTEWTNVTRAKPLFEGHNQPDLPYDLGFYDLRVPDVMIQQVEMAKGYGIQGFCFYHYWFGGQRLLQKPVDLFMADNNLDFNFCICWANENWTRKWDGKDKQILIAQKHEPEDDLAFLDDASKYLLDKRYICIDSKPLLIIYQPSLFPDMKATAARWRYYFREKYNRDLFIAMAQTFGCSDPREYDLDAAIQFPPHNLPAYAINEPQHSGDSDVTIIDASDFSNIYTGNQKENYILYRGLMVNWDNTPRRGSYGVVYQNNTPDNYGKWLDSAIKDTLINNHPGKFIFINAWNEWAEGAHLEPNQRYGYAYLNTTKRILNKHSHSEINQKNGEIIFISHDGHLGGAQIVLLEILKWLRGKTSIRMKLVLLDGGVMTSRFSEFAEILILHDLSDYQQTINRLKAFFSGEENLFYLNSVASGRLIKMLKTFNLPIVTHVHELQKSIEFYAKEYFGDVMHNSDHFIACSQAVSNNMLNMGISIDRISVAHAFTSQNIQGKISNKEKADLKRSLGLPVGKKILIASGLGLFWRKGADLFIDVCYEYSNLSQSSDYLFLWIGCFTEENHTRYGTWDQQEERIISLGIKDKISFPGEKQDLRKYLQAADVFILPSREDPFPLVCLEAADCYLPVICFSGAGGMPEFVREDAGMVVPFENTAKMAQAALFFIQNEEDLESRGRIAHERFISTHTVDATMPKILHTIRKSGRIAPLVSVIVPNYNYGKYLEARLHSIYDQTFQDFEVIILDDGSTDDSLEIIRKFEDKSNTTIFLNPINSGSVFNQWNKGVQMASGKFIWIAESDDLSDRNFLQKVLTVFNDDEVRLVYCNSHVMDENGRISELFYNQCGYYNGLGYPSDRWRHDYTNSGEDEIRKVLSIKNTIPNSSAAIFRKDDFISMAWSIPNHVAYVHDWMSYISIIQKGKIAYITEPLNYHRRHQSSVIAHSLNSSEKVLNEHFFIHNWIESQWELNEETKYNIIKYMQTTVSNLSKDKQISCLPEIINYYRLS